MSDVQEQIRPTAREIDAAVRQLNQLDAAQKPTARQVKAAALAKDLRAQLLGWALAFGETLATAPSSKRLTGLKQIITAIGGTLTSEHPDAVIALRDAMSAAKQDAVFAQMFTPVTRYERSAEAENNLKNAKLPKKLFARFSEMLAKTFSTRARAASLKIEPVKAVKESK